MHFTGLTAAAAVMAAAAVAQGPTNSFNSSDLESLNTTGAETNGYMTSVSLTTRVSWCNAQRTACQTLCGGSVSDWTQNNCDANALTWQCLCQSNNSAPGLQWYSATMPGQICNQLNGNCMAETASDSDAQSAQANCNASYVCGTLNISNVNLAKASASASSSMSTSATASATASNTAATQSGAAIALQLSESYGAGFLAAGIVAAFGYLL